MVRCRHCGGGIEQEDGIWSHVVDHLVPCIDMLGHQCAARPTRSYESVASLQAADECGIDFFDNDKGPAEAGPESAGTVRLADQDEATRP